MSSQSSVVWLADGSRWLNVVESVRAADAWEHRPLALKLRQGPPKKPRYRRHRQSSTLLSRAERVRVRCFDWKAAASGEQLHSIDEFKTPTPQRQGARRGARRQARHPSSSAQASSSLNSSSLATLTSTILEESPSMLHSLSPVPSYASSRRRLGAATPLMMSPMVTVMSLSSSSSSLPSGL